MKWKSIAGILCLFFIACRMIPDDAASAQRAEKFAVRPYLSEIINKHGSVLEGMPLEDVRIGQTLGLTTIHFIRE